MEEGKCTPLPGFGILRNVVEQNSSSCGVAARKQKQREGEREEEVGTGRGRISRLPLFPFSFCLCWSLGDVDAHSQVGCFFLSQSYQEAAMQTHTGAPD